MAPGSLKGLQLGVADAAAARTSCSRGVECSEIQVFDERDGGTLFWFADPDGNAWAVQQLKVRGEKPLIPTPIRSSGTSTWRPKTSASVPMISPSVAYVDTRRSAPASG